MLSKRSITRQSRTGSLYSVSQSSMSFSSESGKFVSQKDKQVSTDWIRNIDMKKKQDELEAEMHEEHGINWINIIFLPFQQWWQIIIIFTVCVKCFLGPMTSIFPFVYCSQAIDEHPTYSYLKIYYVYIGDPIYVIDTFLYIIHRQVVDEAMKREHLPKPAVLLFLDMLSLVPFFNLFGGEQCSPISIWPNIMYFHEMFCIYRVGHYFSLNVTHSLRQLVIGYMIMLVLFINAITCLFLLLTFYGLCKKCADGLYDWRVFTYANLHINTGGDTGIYLYAANFLMSIVTHYMIDETKPNTIWEYFIVDVLMQLGYIITMFVIMPKLFGEITIRYASIRDYQPRARRIIEEIKKRNPSLKAQRKIEQFYIVMWTKHNGITKMPPAIYELPIEITLEIKLDLVWSVLYHSPTFRRTSMAFKRFLCQFVEIKYKLPGERFFTGQNCYSNLYYIKTGVVNLISADESAAPLLSMTSGTVLGDVSFFVPPKDRHIFVRCSSYCEIFSISRRDILKSLHYFPEDRQLVMRLVHERIKHANELYALKRETKGHDRCEDEGIQWFRRRWWEISDAISAWKQLSRKLRGRQKCRIPPEEENYHCCKFIGQLVLSRDLHLQRKSLFIKLKFPWLLLPNSTFNHVWNWIIRVTVLIALITYPPLITKTKLEGSMVLWFKYFDFIVSAMYVLDVLVLLFTVVEGYEHDTGVFSSVVNRFRNKQFILDLLATPWIDLALEALGFQKYVLLSRYNRLIKTYMLMSSRTKADWRGDHLAHVYTQLAVLCFTCIYIPAYFIYLLTVEVPDFTTSYFFGDFCVHDDLSLCDPNVGHSLSGLPAVPFTWLATLMYSNNIAKTFWDIILAGFMCIFHIILFIFIKVCHICALYAIYEDRISYQFIVTCARKYFAVMRIHPDLMTRLNRYLDIHWRYHKGMDVLYPNLMRNEPYDIYWNIHGEVAMKLISQSKAFQGASNALITELAKKADFLMIPKNGIIFAFGVQLETVTWIANGSVKCEYLDDDGKSHELVYNRKEVVGMTAVFWGETALRTYSAITDCEVLVLNLHDFATICQRYPDDWRIFEDIISETRDDFMALYREYITKHKHYRHKLRARIFKNKRSVTSLNKLKKEKEEKRDEKSKKKKDKKNKEGGESIVVKYIVNPLKNVWTKYRTDPESTFIRYWLAIRAFTVFVYAIAGALQGGSGAVIFMPLQQIQNVCVVFTILDIVIKSFIPYYRQDGVIITEYHMCAKHYMTRGFAADLIGLVISYPGVPSLLLSEEVQRAQRLLNSVADCIHLYLLTGFFDYYADQNSTSCVYIWILKYQVVTIILMLHLSYYYVWDCILVTFDKGGGINKLTKANKTCWMPMQFKLDASPTIEQLHIVFAQSINLIQATLLNTFMSYFNFTYDSLKHVAIFTPFTIYFWYQTCYSEMLLILRLQGHSRVYHGTNQLVKFLKEERVDKVTIDRAIDYFSYWWKRTLGIDLSSIMSSKFSVVFREDLYYYFYKTTLKATATILRGPESVIRQIASVCNQLHLLPNEDIVREDYLSSDIYIVHRGEVAIYKHERKLATLTKGAMFGLVEGIKPHPMRITARTLGYVDVLKISAEEFQHIIGDDVRENMTDHYESLLDFIPLEEPITENPKNTIQYILRAKKIIKLPRMKAPVSANENKNYRRWLFMSWVAEPITTAALVLILITLPADVKGLYTSISVVLDAIHVTYLVSEIFTMHVVIENYECVHKYIGWRKLTDWWLFIDVASVVTPLLTIVTDHWEFQLGRLMRIYNVYFYHKNFFNDYRSRTGAMLLKLVLIVLLLHALTCAWLMIACRSKKHISELPVYIYKLPPKVLNSVDDGEWVETFQRSDGCPRRTRFYNVPHLNKTIKGFLVPRNWKSDYIIAMSYIFILQTHLNMESIMPLSLGEIVFKIVAQYILYLLELWMVSLAISSIYTRYREMYEYDYRVYSLTTYLKQNGICRFLVNSVRTYTKLLWRKYKGSQLPEMTYQAPLCLRQDIFSSLYMYHLKTPAVFNWLPDYFLKQLVVKVKRTVIFPGKCIIRTGDINPRMYFIHEGEVERWYTDRTGENRLSTLLTSSGYFGIVSGLYPNVPVQYTYNTRTIVDLIYLHFDDWQELLDGYPDIKERLYSEANRVKLGATVEKGTQNTQSTLSLK